MSKLFKDLFSADVFHRYKRHFYRRHRNSSQHMDNHSSLLASVVSTKGLSNNAGENNCFLNSAVQILWHLDGFRKNFSLLSHHACVENSCIFCALKVIFTQFQFSEEKVLPPDAVRNALAVAFQDQHRFQLGLMDDAAECFENILTRIHFHLSNGDTGDNCVLEHCISHQKFAMMVIEQMVCECGETSEPFPFVQLVHYITAHTIISLSQKARSDTSFGEKLRLASYSDDNFHNKCPRKCQLQARIKQTLTNVPDVVSIGVIWESDEQSAEQVKNFVEVVGRDLSLVEMFDTVVDEKRAKSTEHKLVGIVCYYGKHYSAFFLHSKSNNWISCDDATVTDMGPNWENVVEKCFKGRYQPLLLLYQNPRAATISTKTAPTTTTMLTSCMPQDTSARNEYEGCQSDGRVREKPQGNYNPVVVKESHCKSSAPSKNPGGNCNLNNSNTNNRTLDSFNQGAKTVSSGPVTRPCESGRPFESKQQLGSKPHLLPRYNASQEHTVPDLPRETSSPLMQSSLPPHIYPNGKVNSLDRNGAIPGNGRYYMTPQPSQSQYEPTHRTWPYGSTGTNRGVQIQSGAHPNIMTTVRPCDNSYPKQAAGLPGHHVFHQPVRPSSESGSYSHSGYGSGFVTSAVPHTSAFGSNCNAMQTFDVVNREPLDGANRNFCKHGDKSDVQSHGIGSALDSGTSGVNMESQAGGDIDLMTWSIINPSPDTSRQTSSSGYADSNSSSSPYDNLHDFGGLSNDSMDPYGMSSTHHHLLRNVSLTDSYFIVPDTVHIEDTATTRDFKETIQEAEELMAQSERKEKFEDLQAAVICCNRAISLYSMLQTSYPSYKLHGIDYRKKLANDRLISLCQRIEDSRKKSKSDIVNKRAAKSWVPDQNYQGSHLDGHNSTTTNDDLIFLDEPSRPSPTPKHQALKDSLPELYNQQVIQRFYVNK